MQKYAPAIGCASKLHKYSSICEEWEEEEEESPFLQAAATAARVPNENLRGASIQRLTVNGRNGAPVLLHMWRGRGQRHGAQRDVRELAGDLLSQEEDLVETLRALARP
jgi:hypothetical protein